MPFSHAPVGGQGNLVATQIQSPNFNEETGQGWRIAKDGSAYFADVQLPNTRPGTTVTFSSTAPASPAAGDIWYDTADGLAASEWDGTGWVAYLIGAGALAYGAVGTDQIADSAVTSALLAAAAVGEQNIADGAVTAAQISAAAGILGSQLSSDAAIASGQVDFTAQDIGGNTVTYSATAPTSPNVGDIWIQTS